MALTGALLKRHGFGIVEALVTITASGSYATGGDTLDFAPVVGYTNRQPNFVTIEGIAGFRYEYDKANKKVLVRQSAGGTFTGTALGTHRHTLHFQTGAAANAVTAATNQLRTAAAAFDVAGVPDSTGEGGVVDVGAGTPTGTVAAGALSELPAAGYPAGVTGDTIVARVTYFQ